MPVQNHAGFFTDVLQNEEKKYKKKTLL